MSPTDRKKKTMEANFISLSLPIFLILCCSMEYLTLCAAFNLCYRQGLYLVTILRGSSRRRPAVPVLYASPILLC